MAIDKSKELYVDINLDSKSVKEQSQVVTSSFNQIELALSNISKQLHNISVNVGNMFANMRNEASKTAQSFNKAFGTFQQTGQLAKGDITKSQAKGNIKTYNLAQRNVAQETFLSNANTKEVIRQQEILKYQEKQIRNQVKIEEGLVKTKNETKNVKNETDKVSKSSTNWFKALSKIGLTVAGLKRVGQVIGELVKESGSWIENLNLFEVTFGDNYQKSLDWAVEFSKQLGFSVNEMVKFTGLFKQLSTSIGIADETGDKLAETLSSIGTDITSFYNLDSIQTAMEKLQAGIFSGKVLPHDKVIYHANPSNLWELFTNGYRKDNLEQRLDNVA